MECPESDEFQNLFEDLLEEDAVEDVAFKHWISTERSTLETNVKQSAEFASMLILRDSILIEPRCLVTSLQFISENSPQTHCHTGLIIMLVMTLLSLTSLRNNYMYYII
jgi:hypothetical protein